MHLLHHHEPATNGAPQTVAVGFASLIFFTLLLPFAKVSIQGNMAPDVLIQLLHTNEGFNVFALVVLLAPALGVGVALLARSAWRVSTMLVALITLIGIPLALYTFGHRLQMATHGAAVVTPGLAAYVLLFGYGVIALITGIVAFRAR
jgi:hypothetical protein